MKVQSYEIRLYKTADGRKPFSEWISSLRDVRARLRIEKRIERLLKGNFGDCKPLKNADGVHELRLDFGPGYRVYFGIAEHTIVLLLCGGDKSSQDKDIRKAVIYWNECKQKGTLL